jgi:hypothetical protein
MLCRRHVPPLMSAALASLLAVGAGRSILLRSGSEAVMVTAEGACSIISEGGSATRTAVSGAGAGIPGAGAKVPGAQVRVLEGGAKAVLLGGECCHLAGEVLDPLQKCGVVRGWTNATERQLRCDLGTRSAQRAAAFKLALCRPARMTCTLSTIDHCRSRCKG